MFGKYSTPLHKEFLFLTKKISRKYHNLIKHISNRNLVKTMIDIIKTIVKKYLSV